MPTPIDLHPPLRRRALVQGLAQGAMLATLAAAAPRPSAAPLASALHLPALALRQRRLANGLQVVSLPHRGSSSVAVQVWYRVGSRDDPPGRSGFAHQFEHMMFKGTRHMAAESFDRLTEDVGGQNNAFTAEDMTVYQSEVPANHLERLLWAEAERMAWLRVDQAGLDSERAVVIEELGERVLAVPYGRLLNALPQQAFGAHHPYGRPVIGSQADLNAATLDEVQRFHASHYRPDNALVIVAGDFDAPELDAWVDRWFGPLRSPDAAVPRASAALHPRSHPARVVLTGPQVPLPAVALVWRGPAAAHDDAPALQIAAALLSSGDSSRLNEALVYRAQIAQSVALWVDLYADAGLIAALAIAAGPLAAGHVTGRLADLEAALMAQIHRLAGTPVAPAELEKVRRQLLTAALLARQTPQGLAQAMGNAALLLGDPRAADRRLARLQAVTAAEVQQVLKRHLLDRPRVTLRYQQQAGR